MMSNIELMPVAISEILDKQFFIRHYQRGYRWTKEQVEQLLEDIDSFNPRELKNNPNKKTFYCLQPVVLKKISETAKAEIINKSNSERKMGGEWYEVIDGQQRLTTIYLILKYRNERWLGEDQEDLFNIDYETRENCVSFLESIKVNPDKTTVKIETRNIDFYHISNAYQVIRNWELNYENNSKKKFDKNEFQSKFLNYSKIIWYEVDDSENSIELFERLNLGKIPLTNAELTKALFLSLDSFKELPSEEQKIKHFEIASKWDEMEHKLNEADQKFWAFITNKPRDSFATKIDLILDQIAEKKDGEPDHFFAFLYFLNKSKESSSSASGLSLAWQEIENFYNTLLEWNTDKNLYHYVGYLIASKEFAGYKKASLISLVKYSMKNDKKSFEEYLTNKIKASVNVNLSEIRYDQHYNQIYNMLLLFNVETYRTSSSIDDFYPFKQHKANQWSLEHIHAQNSDGLDQTKKEQWIHWLKLHKTVLDALKKKNAFLPQKPNIEQVLLDLSNISDTNLSWTLFSGFFDRICKILSSDKEQSDSETHGLANMALLSQPDNAALNCSAFLVKRNHILDLDKEGKFVPLCTRRVFQGYYLIKPNNEEEFFFWGPEEKNGYMESIKNMLNKYLPLNNGNHEGK